MKSKRAASMYKPIPLIVHGSTGSIGTQALDVVRRLRGKKDFEVFALVCRGNVDLMASQINEFKPKYAVVVEEKAAQKVLDRIVQKKTKLFAGEAAATEVCGKISGGYVVIATSGFAGLAPTLQAIEAGNSVAVANKEAFLTAGKLIFDAAKRNDVEVLPIDSEPSAVWQCLENDVLVLDGQRRSAIWHLQRGAAHDVKNVILTCSGGPFRAAPYGEMLRADAKSALRHPNWSMGSLITIRSATLMNKGMERIEISSIFNIPIDDIKIVIHPQSIVHSGVELADGSQKVQQGPHDMRYPIAYSLTFPYRYDIGIEKLKLANNMKFEFSQPDEHRFPSLSIAYKAGKMGGTAPAVLNGADEVAVGLFMEDKIGFMDVPKIVGVVVDIHRPVKNPTLADIIRADKWAREVATEVGSAIMKSSGVRR